MAEFNFSRMPSQQTSVTADGLGQAKAENTLVIIGHAAEGASAANLDKPIIIENYGNEKNAETECEAKFGADSEVGKMVVAAILAAKNSQQVPSVIPPIIVLALAHDDNDLETLLQDNESVPMPYVAVWFGASDTALCETLKTHLVFISGPNRGMYGQFGSFGFVTANGTLATVAPYGTAMKSEKIVIPWLKDTAVAKENSVANLGAQLGVMAAQNPLPFNPLNKLEVFGVKPPVSRADFISPEVTGDGALALDAGLSPLLVNNNGKVFISRLITTVRTLDNDPDYAYFDLPDWQVLYYFRKLCYNITQRPNYIRSKASVNTLKNMMSDFIAVAKDLEKQGMLQHVDKFADKFKIEKDPTGRSEYVFRIPVNVIPGLHSIGVDILGTTLFDVVEI